MLLPGVVRGPGGCDLGAEAAGQTAERSQGAAQRSRQHPQPAPRAAGWDHRSPE